jgi:hypothetical protein
MARGKNKPRTTKISRLKPIQGLFTQPALGMMREDCGATFALAAFLENRSGQPTTSGWELAF